MKKGSTSLIIILIVVVVVIVAGYFILSKKSVAPGDDQNQSSSTVPEVNSNQPATNKELPVADFKTYNNVKYGFEFQYPKSWDISSDVDSPVQVSIIFSDSSKNMIFAVAVFPKLGALQEVKKDFSSIIEEKSTTVLGMSATKITGVSKFSGQTENDIIFEKSGKTYIFGSFSSSVSLDQIISTLKFK